MKPIEILQWFKDEGLPNYVIAKILKARENFISENNIHRIDTGRLILLYNLFNVNKEANLKTLYHLFYWKFEDDTLEKLLRKKELNSEKIQKILNYLWPHAKKYMEWHQKLKANIKRRKNASNAALA